MPKVRIDDRTALERAYPPDAFAADAARNAATSSEAVNGVRILSAPDDAGEFSLERGSRQVGEAASVFLVPYRRRGNAGEPEAVSSDPTAGYQAFLDDIVNAASRFGYRPEESPGPSDQRIRGPRQ
jgi:hypothetical protein